MPKKIYDSTYRTIARKMPKLFVPLINEAFGRSYPFDAPIAQRNNAFKSGNGWIETDSIFELGGSTYHIECQTTNPANMALRMLEYGFQIGSSQMRGSSKSTDHGVWGIPLPSSCVVYLRSAPNELDARIFGPDGDCLALRPRILRAKSYDMDDMFSKKLIVLYPFYLMRYERKLGAIAADSKRRQLLLDECARLGEGLSDALGDPLDESLYNEIVRLADEVNAHVFRKHPDLGKEARAAMGGEILELWSEKVERLEREKAEAEARAAMGGEILELWSEKVERLEREKAEAEARTESVKAEAKREMLQSLVEDGLLSAEVAAEKLGISHEEFAALR